MVSVKEKLMLKGDIFLNKDGEWCKKCPSCMDIQSYWSYAECINSLRQYTKCNKCAKSGSNNPAFGKSPSISTRNKLSVSGKGKHKIPCPLSKKMKISETKRKRDISVLPHIGNNQYKRKQYIFPNGRTEWVQGYEPLTIDYLLSSSIQVNDIKISGKERPVINYNWSGSINRYLPDCYISSSNMIVETKSIWTWKSRLEQNKAKISGSVNSGYTTRLIVWGHNKTLVQDVIFF